MEQEMHYRRLTQEQIDAFTLDMNSAYARLKGIEEAIDSECIIVVLFLWWFLLYHSCRKLIYMLE